MERDQVGCPVEHGHHAGEPDRIQERPRTSSGSTPEQGAYDDFSDRSRSDRGSPAKGGGVPRAHHTDLQAELDPFNPAAGPLTDEGVRALTRGDRGLVDITLS